MSAARLLHDRELLFVVISQDLFWLLMNKILLLQGNFGYTEKTIVHPSQRSILELSPPTPAPTNSSHNASMSHATPGVISPSPSEHSERQEKTNSLSAVNPFLSMPELSQGEYFLLFRCWLQDISYFVCPPILIIIGKSEVSCNWFGDRNCFKSQIAMTT